jgi:hypothetical protein
MRHEIPPQEGVRFAHAGSGITRTWFAVLMLGIITDSGSPVASRQSERGLQVDWP